MHHHIFLIFLLSFFFLGALSCANDNAARKPPANAANVAPFPSSPDWQKLDLRMQDAWRVSDRGEKATKPVECMLKTTRDLKAKEKEKLAAAGFQGRTYLGNIITGSFEMKRLPEIATLPFVEVIELAVPLSIK